METKVAHVTFGSLMFDKDFAVETHSLVTTKCKSIKADVIFTSAFGWT